MTTALPKISFWLPDQTLRPYVTSYYAVDSAGPLRDNLHPEWGNIRFVFRGDWFIEKAGSMTPAPAAALYGPTDRTAQFTTIAGSAMGVGLTPAGWMRLVRTDAHTLANAVEPLADRLGVPDDVLRDKLVKADDDDARVAALNRILTDRLVDAPETDPVVADIQQALSDNDIADVRALAERVGLTDKTLQRACLRAFGFTPKRLLRRQRFLRTLDRLRDRLGEPLAGLVDDDYYDQAHFNREFRTYMGMSPTAYFRSPREVMRRAAQERERIVGAAMQGLHKEASAAR